MLTAMIFAQDHDAMVAFYRAGFDLGVDAAASSDGYTVLSGEAVRLSIHAMPADVAERIALVTPPEPRRDGAVKLLFEVPSFAETCARLVSLGGQLFESTSVDEVDGCDIEGNVFRVSSAPSA